MCGIIAYTGSQSAVPYLVEGLERLEYRGYDSAGIAVINDGNINVVKSSGKLEKLKSKLEKITLSGNAGIGHTRWATHGKPSDENSHPHLSEKGLFAVVHNGIIENYGIIKERLLNDGVLFSSETDTEVISQLLEKEYDGNFLGTVKRVTETLDGAYAIAVICRDYEGEIICTRKQSPLVVGRGKSGMLAASDVTALLKHTEDIFKLSDGEFAVIKKDGAEFFDNSLQPLKKEKEFVIHDDLKSEKGDYEHYMLKEIEEQPKVLENLVSLYVKGDRINFKNTFFSPEYLKSINRIYIVACGSAYHAGMMGKYIIEKLTGIPVMTESASEFRYGAPPLDSGSPVIAVTQSGETADTIAAIRLSKEKGARVLSIVNVTSSTAATESDDVIYTNAGPEIAVATTKAYSCQLMTLCLVAVHIADALGKITESEKKILLSHIRLIASQVETALELTDEIKQTSELFSKAQHVYFIGRNVDYAAALEASLKLKEISYIHSEAYGAGELKHGTISLIEKDTLVVALCCCDDVFQKTLSNVREVIARGARVVCVVTEKHKDEVDDIGTKIVLPDIYPLFAGSIEVIPMQLLAYYTAKIKGCDIDKPRNLAKSVTVE